MRLVIYTALGLLSAACGGATVSGPEAGGAAGYSGTGSAGNVAVTSGAGGGSSGSGGVAGSGNASGGTNPNYLSRIPAGTIQSCSGTACPGGPCGGSPEFGREECGETITPSYEYCEPGANGSQCVVVVASGFEVWLVVCTNGSPAIWKCGGSCESIGGQGAYCPISSET